MWARRNFLSVRHLVRFKVRSANFGRGVFRGGWLGACAPTAFRADIATFLVYHLARTLRADLELFPYALRAAYQGNREKLRRVRYLSLLRFFLVFGRFMLLAGCYENLAFD